MNKIFRCGYDEQWGYGAFQEMECIVVAPDKDTALKMVVEQYIDCPNPNSWKVIEINTSEPKCMFVSSRSS